MAGGYPFDVVTQEICAGAQTGFGVAATVDQRIPCTATFTPGYVYDQPNLYSGTRERNLVVAQNEYNCAVRLQMPFFPRWMPFFVPAFWGLPAGQPTTVFGTGKRWAFDTSVPADTPLLPLTFQVKWGPDFWTALDVVWQQITIRGQQGQSIATEWTGFAGSFQPLAAGSAVTLPLVKDKPLQFWQHKLYLDPADTTPGTTEVDEYLKTFDLSVTNGAVPHYNKNNSRFYGYISRTFFGYGLTLNGLEPSSRFQFNEFDGGITQLGRISQIGAAITGPPPGNQGLDITWSGIWTGREPNDDQGAGALRLVNMPEADGTLGYSLELAITNTQAAYAALGADASSNGGGGGGSGTQPPPEEQMPAAA